MASANQKQGIQHPQTTKQMHRFIVKLPYGLPDVTVDVDLQTATYETLMREVEAKTGIAVEN